MSDGADCLLEIGTEELPPRSLVRLAEALGRGLAAGLAEAGLAHDGYRIFASPRRLAVLVERLAAAQAPVRQERRGPAMTAAFDALGNPTPAALGFARSCGVEVGELGTLETNKGVWLAFRVERPGESAAQLLPGLVAGALAALPVPRPMRWGAGEATFVRPVHWVVLLHGNEVVPGRFFGLPTGRDTRGHRFHHPGHLRLANPAAYVPLLATTGHVLADPETRRAAIREQVGQAARRLGAIADVDPALLEEVAGMVEWPRAVAGRFDERFLALPEEVLVAAMKAHQKYFPVRDAEGRLMPAFIAISNIESRNPDAVREGNERVIRPRLEDAAFFWDQDRRLSLADRLPALGSVIFQRDLGSLHDKAARLARLAGEIAPFLGADPKPAGRAAWLAKCDLLTAMVGEFPELQGIMGRHYAGHDGEGADVAEAIAEHYLPRAARDALPRTPAGQIVAVADRIDSLVGIFGIGRAPTGDRDPFALRRAALGLVRIIIERGLDRLSLPWLIGRGLAAYEAQKIRLPDAADVEARVLGFVMERLRAHYQAAGVVPEVFEAVRVRGPERPVDLDARVRALQTFCGLPEAASLVAAHRRIGNILRRTDDPAAERLEPRLLQEPAERALGEAILAVGDELDVLTGRGNYDAALRLLAGLRDVVDRFFDEVLVMSEDARVRANRLRLLEDLQRLFLQIADLSELAVKAPDEASGST